MPKLNIQDKVANPGESSDHRGRPNDFKFVLGFGAYGNVKCLVYGRSLDSALEDCVEWLEQHAPGVFADEQVSDEYKRQIELGLDDEKAHEEATVDTIYIDPGHYLNSWEVVVIAENPTRAQLTEIFT